jgi:hypothetical protein
MNRILPAISTLLLLTACGMNPAEQEEFLQRTVTLHTAPLSGRGDSGLIAWVRAEARGGASMTALRVRVFDDANGDGAMQDEEYSGIARVREGDGEVLLKISTITFPQNFLRPMLLCEVDTDQGMHTQVIALK